MQKTLTTERHKALIELMTRYREKTGITQAGLAEQLGEYQSFVARLESGQRRLDVIEFMRLAKILKFNESDILAQLKRIAD